MKKLILPVLTVLVVCAGFWLYTGPQRTLRGIKAAAQAGDVEGVRERVDLPAVKESLKEQFHTVMQQKIGAEMQGNPFGAIGMFMAETMIEGIVEQAVTPTRLVALIQGNRSAAFSQNSGSAAEETTEPADQNAEWEGSFDSIDRYTMNMLNKETRKPDMSLTFRREGLSWKLTSVRLPLDDILDMSESEEE